MDKRRHSSIVGALDTMQTTPICAEHLADSVIAVPPLCRDDSLRIDHAENAKLIKHIESGGVRTLLYGGNANLYHIAVSEYGELLDMLESAAAEDSLIVPSVGPSYGNILDQAAILKDRQFPAAMILPAVFPIAEEGVKASVRAFVEAAGIPAVLYIKNEGYVTPQDAAELVNEGIISWIKYAIVREDTANDPFLAQLVDLVDPSIIVSGIGEQPAATHLLKFGINGFTSGCVCVQPSLSMEMLAALKEGNTERAESIRQIFEPLEDLRNAHGPIPVLHHAVATAAIANTGPHLPLLASLENDLVATIGTTASALLNVSFE